jgi:hypothetical protein
MFTGLPSIAGIAACARGGGKTWRQGSPVGLSRCARSVQFGRT